VLARKAYAKAATRGPAPPSPDTALADWKARLTVDGADFDCRQNAGLVTCERALEVVPR